MTHLTAVDTNIKQFNRISLVLILTLYFSFPPFYGIGIVKRDFLSIYSKRITRPLFPKPPHHQKTVGGHKPHRIYQSSIPNRVDTFYYDCLHHCHYLLLLLALAAHRYSDQFCGVEVLGLVHQVVDCNISPI